MGQKHLTYISSPNPISLVVINKKATLIKWPLLYVAVNIPLRYKKITFSPKVRCFCGRLKITKSFNV